MWNWVQENPAEAAWAVFGIITTIILAYRAIEPSLKVWVKRTKNTTDDKILWTISHIIHLFSILLDAAALVVPYFAGKPPDLSFYEDFSEDRETDPEIPSKKGGSDEN